MRAPRKGHFTPYGETFTEVTLTMNDGGIFRVSRATKELVQVGQREPVSGTNQEESNCPVADGVSKT